MRDKVNMIFLYKDNFTYHKNKNSSKQLHLT